MSFDYDPQDITSEIVPISTRQCPDNLVGYLAVCWPTEDIDVPAYMLQIVLVAEKLDHLKYFATVKMNDVFNCFAASKEIENNRPHDY